MESNSVLVKKMNFLYSKKKTPQSFEELEKGDVLTRKNIGELVFDSFEGENIICYEFGRRYSLGKFMGDIVVSRIPRNLVKFNFEGGSYTEIDKFGGKVEEDILKEGRDYEKYKSYLIKLGLTEK